MESRTTGRPGQADEAGRPASERSPDPYRAFSAQADRAWEHEQRRADRLERHRILMLLGVGAAVVFGVFALVGSPAAVDRTSSAALGSVVLGLVALGSAALLLLGLSPPRAPSPPAGTVRDAVLRAFFSGRVRDSRPGRHEDEGTADGSAPTREVLERAADFPAPAPATISGAHRSTMRASVRAAQEVRDENERRERHLGWARSGIALGLTFLVAGGVLSLSPYAGAVLLVLGGATVLLLIWWPGSG